jgi:GH35 family endo-1,4-beta-xylanase
MQIIAWQAKACARFHMLRFAVYDEHRPAAQWSLANAYPVGQDDQPVRGEVSFESGHIVCRRRGGGAVGLCLPYHAGSMGTLMLQTCLLPDRREPYILSVELARHRVKMFIAKSEEWAMFDLSAEHPAMQLWEQARRLSSEAWLATDPRRADRAARKSLNYAIDASERLTMAHAEILLHRRFGQRPASNATLGARIWPGRDAQPLRDLIAKDFDLLAIPINWRELEVAEGTYNWAALDRWMEWASKQGKPIVAGPLLNFSRSALPEWMYVWQNDYDTCRDLVYSHMERVVERYKGVVGMWNIASGVNTNDNFTFSAEQMLDLVRMAALLVRHMRKGAKVMLELAQPFGEHVAFNHESLHPLTFVDRLVQEGVRMDALGVQLMFGTTKEGRVARDLAQISSMLDRFFLLEIPVIISAMGVPSEPVDEQAGVWHEPWSPQLQQKWMSRVFAICLSKPFVETLFWGDLFDHALAEVPNAGLISQSGKPKPGLARLINLRKHLRKPLGPLKLPSKHATMSNIRSEV